MTEPEAISIWRALESICLDRSISNSQLIIKPYLDNGQLIGYIGKLVCFAPVFQQVVYDGVFLKARRLLLNGFVSSLAKVALG
jgi:hypothetical protein